MLDELKAKIATGELTRTSLVWQVGTKDWVEVQTIPELVSQVKAPPLLFASPWKRAGALLIDAALLLVAGLILSFLFGTTLAAYSETNREYAARMNGLGYLLAWLYHAIMESSSKQGTVGKVILGLRVTDLAGQPIGFGRATARHFGKIISTLLLLGGFIIAFFTQKKQCLHDMMAGCLVLDANAQSLPATSSGNGRAVATSRPSSAYSSVTSPVSIAPTVQPSIGTVKSDELKVVTPAESLVVDEDAIYAAIANELESRTTDKGLWTRLFAECDGDENRTKVAYIKLRAAKLISADRVRLEKYQQEQAEGVAIAEQHRLNKLTNRNRMLERMEKGEASALQDSIIINLVRLGDINRVAELINTEPLFVVVKNAEGNTPLHVAIEEQHLGMVKLLVDAGAPLIACNRFGLTPLDASKRYPKILAAIQESLD